MEKRHSLDISSLWLIGEVDLESEQKFQGALLSQRVSTGIEQITENIDHLDFHVDCDYMDCQGRATHRLICAKCGLFEFMCDPHAEAAKQAPKNSWIVFDKSCKHRVDMFYCGKEPI